MRRQTITRDCGPGGPEQMPAPGGWQFDKTAVEVWYWLLAETRAKTFKRQRDKFASEAKIDALARVLANALGMASFYWVEEAKAVVAEEGT